MILSVFNCCVVVFLSIYKFKILVFCFGFDPEFTSTGSAMGLDMGSYPSSKKVVFGLNVAF